MSLINYHTKCRVCGHKDLHGFFNLGDHYLHGSFVFPDFNPPTRKIPTALARCNNQTGGCGLVQLTNSVDPDVLYARYGYRSGTNETMRTHLSDIVKNVVTLLSKESGGHASCLDIGCNDGYLLGQYPDGYEKCGIDPCDIINTLKDSENTRFIQGLYPNSQIEDMQFDVITMIACFYDLNDPVGVTQKIAQNLDDNGIAIIEVSYWPDKMKSNAFDEVCHEHVCFYNYQNLEDVMHRAGLRVFNAKKNDINGGSIQIWVCKPEALETYSTPENRQNILALKFDEMNQKLDTSDPYTEFWMRCQQVRGEIRQLFMKIQQEKKTVHLYGASTKGNVLLQYLDLDSRHMPYAAERSIEKVGGKTLGTDIKMISENQSRAMKPDYYFVPIWSFRREIIKRESEFLKGGGKLIFPLPKLEIVG